MAKWLKVGQTVVNFDFAEHADVYFCPVTE